VCVKGGGKKNEKDILLVSCAFSSSSLSVLPLLPGFPTGIFFPGIA
jgi:hypothetical protein